MSNNRNQAPSGRRANQGGQKPLFVSAARISILSDIKIDSLLAKILSDANLKIRVEIDSNNQAAVTLVDIDTGKMTGSTADIAKLTGLRKFANDEKKKSVADSIMGPIESLLTASVKDVRSNPTQAAFLPGKLTPGALEALKDSNNRVRILLENRSTLQVASANSPVEQRQTIQALLAWVASSVEAHASLVNAAVRGRDLKGLLTEALFLRGVPAWVHAKLTTARLASLVGADFRRVLFPPDVKKGVSLSVKEWTDTAFRAANTWLTQYSGAVIRILESQPALRAMTGVTVNIDFTNEADAIGSALRGEKVLVTPHYHGLEYFFEPHAKGKYSSFAQRADFSSPRAALRTVMESVLASQLGEVRTGDQVASYWGPLTEGLGIDFRTNINARRNLHRVALDNQQVVGPRFEAIFAIGKEKACVVFYNLLLVGLQLPSTSPIFAALWEALAPSGDGVDTQETWNEALDVSSVKYGTTTTDLLPEVAPNAVGGNPIHNTLTGDLSSEADRNLKREVCAAAGTRRAPQARANRRTATSSLSALNPASKKVSRRFTGDLAFLKEPIEGWLRGFVSEAMQTAAANLVAAQMDSLLSDEDEDASDDDERVDDEEGDE